MFSQKHAMKLDVYYSEQVLVDWLKSVYLEGYA